MYVCSSNNLNKQLIEFSDGDVESSTRSTWCTHAVIRTKAYTAEAVTLYYLSLL